MSDQLDLPSRPDVPTDLIVDFDYYALQDDEGDLQRAWFHLAQGNPPIFWTPHYGGHWVTTRGDYITEIQLDHQRFSMRYHGLPKGRKGIPSPPLDRDPPEHQKYRALINPFFSPKALQDISVTVGETLDEIMARVAPLGECEFMNDVARHLPIIVFLRMMGLPLEDREMLLDMNEAYSSAKELGAAQAARRALADYIDRYIVERRENPRDDVLSRVVTSQIDGQPIGDAELTGLCTLLLAGGLDTVKSFIGFAMRFLATHPDHVRQLREDAALIPHAIEELVRRHGIAQTSRVLTCDTEFHGVVLRKGEMIQIPNSLVGLDPALVDDPLTVNFNRQAPIVHGAFGKAHHNCPGARLARIEAKMLIEAWLMRIPEFQLKPETTPRAQCGPTNQLKELWLTWPVDRG